ncbi:hypothetical protein [Bizionia paragorgiae]|uniref:Uncharacterized protein n=1 Tax=Bizionia paragorgiae TaxID=283786 RepID=A0A1H3YNI8_BIZPA|nr:hypothetical protein [Bizionia paragorgiae]SEA13063.1 hypothetical protein SAMN04487990_10716 [Bizionia paragorgiae]
MKKIQEIRNVIAKTILWLLGIIIITSVFWGFILQGFNLNTSPAKDLTRTHYELISISFIFMLGAIFYNRILDSLVSILEFLSKKLTSK